MSASVVLIDMPQLGAPGLGLECTRLSLRLVTTMLNNAYHPVTKSLHWIMFVLIALALAIIEVREEIPKDTPLRVSL